MKYLILSAIFLFAVQSGAGDSLLDDSKLIGVIKLLPRGWKAFGIAKIFFIERDEEIFILDCNRINAPTAFEKPEDKKKRFEKFGRKIKMVISLTMEEKWPKDRSQKAKSQNSKVMEEIGKLPQKLGMEKLLGSPPFRKGIENAYCEKPEDEKKLKEFREQKSELEKKLQVIPDFNSEKFSLFWDSLEDYEDEFHEVLPSEACREFHEIKGILREQLIELNE